MTNFLLSHLDYVILAAGAVVVFAGLHRWLWRGRARGVVVPVMWMIVLTVLGSGWFLVEGAAQRERDRLRQMVEGYAPTYAQELGRIGHQEITLKTSPDDPKYWRMIEAEKRWLKVNPAINDIYTLRKLPDGRVALIVDSETDYDRDGKFEGEREQRPKIGEVYDGDLAQVMDAVLAGQTVFQDTPATDRWGTWVSALVPIRDFKGDVEAVLGVDFDATRWVAAIQNARLTTIGYLAIFLLIVAGGSALLMHQIATRDLQRQLREQEGVRGEKQRFETLVNSVDGIVWEADAQTFRFRFVSRQSERLLGYTPEHWLASENFWCEKLHPDDQWAIADRTRRVAEKASYACEYRMLAADGRTVWIRESAAVTPDSDGQPLVVQGVFYDITAQKRAAEELERANSSLVDSSRFAGMAEVATGVLHNVGNVLNSVNVSGNVISDRLRGSKVIELGKVAGLLTLQAADFAGFVARDPRGPHIPELISRVAEALRAEHAELLEEVDSITRNIAHIKEIVSMQQGFAKGHGIVEELDVQAVVDDAIKINSTALTRHRITVVQAFEEVPRVLVDKHLVLQILVNLLRNAKQAIESSGRDERRVVVKIQGNGEEFVKIAVQDSGAGIAPENLTRIFSHGFTTKKDGHGFGLHSSALAATGMGGALSAHSDGPGTGAIFTLDLPVARAGTAAVA
jgi:PAS domain S-box-containing protein